MIKRITDRENVELSCILFFIGEKLVKILFYSELISSFQSYSFIAMIYYEHEKINESGAVCLRG